MSARLTVAALLAARTSARVQSPQGEETAAADTPAQPLCNGAGTASLATAHPANCRTPQLVALSAVPHPACHARSVGHHARTQPRTRTDHRPRPTGKTDVPDVREFSVLSHVMSKGRMSGCELTIRGITIRFRISRIRSSLEHAAPAAAPGELPVRDSWVIL